MKENETVINGSKNGSVKWIPIAGFIGLAAGTIIGLMYAPKEGKVTRRYLKEKAGSMGKRVKTAVGEVQSKVMDKDDSGKTPTATS